MRVIPNKPQMPSSREADHCGRVGDKPTFLLSHIDMSIKQVLQEDATNDATVSASDRRRGAAADPVQPVWESEQINKPVPCTRVQTLFVEFRHLLCMSQSRCRRGVPFALGGHTGSGCGPLSRRGHE